MDIIEHDPETINMWMKKKGYNYNSEYKSAPITLYFHEKGLVTIDVCNDLKNSIKTNELIITYALLKQVNESTCHYCCIYIDFSNKKLIVFDPFGYNKHNRVIVRKTYCAISIWIKKYTGIILDNKYTNIEYGPQYYNRSYDSGSLICIIIYHISKDDNNPIEIFDRISKLQLSELTSQIVKANEIVYKSSLPPQQIDYFYDGDVNMMDYYIECDTDKSLSKKDLGDKYRSINDGIALYGTRVHVNIR